MAEISLNLVVLRVSDVERAAEFYRLLGLRLEPEQHGKGPLHYAAEAGAAVFEIYPRKSGTDSMASTRIGFRVDSIAAILEVLQEAGGKIVSAPQASDWGLRAVIEDPDGHRIELTEAAPS